MKRAKEIEIGDLQHIWTHFLALKIKNFKVVILKIYY
jgi:hypothetical protein